ncbi:glycosyltransferase family 4 protein, partial [Motilibacter deserti]
MTDAAATSRDIGGPILAHVPVPFSRSGDSVTNVIRAYAKEHARRGGRTLVPMADNRDVAVESAEVLPVDYTRYCPRQWWMPRELWVDFALGSAGLPRPYTGRIQRPAAELLAAQKPAAVFVHEAYYAASTLPDWRRHLGDIPLYLYVHVAISRSYRPREMRRLLRAADGVITVSQFMADHVHERAGGSPVPVSVVLNGTDTARFAPPAAWPQASSERLRLMFVGVVAPHKGPHLLVEAVARMVKAGLPVELVVVGSSVRDPTHQVSAYEQDLRRIAAPAGDAIRFRPFVPHEQLPDIYREADVVIAPSMVDEACPLVVLEGLSSGAVVVATRRGGTPEAGG